MLYFLCTATATRFFVWAFVIHLIGDWLLQNDWMARNKSNLRHPAAWLHSGLHYLGLLLIFPIWMAALVALSHLLIDTRIPLVWWRRVYRQTQKGEIALHVALWSDQVAHIAVLALASLIVGRML